jgi:hypothetical protein
MFSTSNLENIWGHDTIAKLQWRRRLFVLLQCRMKYLRKEAISKAANNYIFWLHTEDIRSEGIQTEIQLSNFQFKSRHPFSTISDGLKKYLE